MKDDKKKNILIIILILLVIIFVIKFIIEKIENYDPSREAIEEYGYETMGVYKDPEVEEEEEKTISYGNISVLQSLNGKLPVSTVSDKVRKTFVEEIPKVLEETKDMSKQEIIKYYTDNELDIKNNMSIETQESFLNMISKFEALTSDISSEYDACRFANDDELKLVFFYENGETVECKIVGDNANTVMFEF